MKRRARILAFSLMEVAVTLVIAGFVAGLFLTYTQSHGNSSECYDLTKAQLREVQDAIDRFVQKNDRYPLPALRTLGVESPQFGREASLAQLDTTASAPTVTMGALPFQALGLAPSYAGDCFGNKLTYAVTTDLTDSTKFLSTAPVYPGGVAIKNAVTPATDIVSYAVISHGANGTGAVKTNYSDTSGTPNKKWCSYGPATDPVEKENCAAPVSTIITGEYNDGKASILQGYDDIVVFKGRNATIPVVNGLCDVTRGNCLQGSASGLTSNGCGNTDTWTCVGTGPAHTDAPCSVTNAPCCTSAVCGTANYTCVVGAPVNQVYRNCAGVLGEFSQHFWYCDNGVSRVGCAGPPWGPNCFLPETRITLADGSTKAVRDLKPGDEVRSRTGINRVQSVPSFSNAQRIYGFNGGEKFVTGGHPFFTKSGWKAIQPSLTVREGHSVKTTQLKTGDQLLLVSGEWKTITSIDEEATGEHELFNPVMDGDHTYFAAGYLVHNKAMGADCAIQPNPSGTCTPSGFPNMNTDYALPCCSGVSGGIGDGCIGDGPGGCGCIADGLGYGGVPAACCNPDLDGNGLCGVNCPIGTIWQVNTASHIFCKTGSDVNGWGHICSGVPPATLSEITVINRTTAAYNSAYSCPADPPNMVFNPSPPYTYTLP